MVHCRFAPITVVLLAIVVLASVPFWLMPAVVRAQDSSQVTISVSGADNAIITRSTELTGSTGLFVGDVQAIASLLDTTDSRPGGLDNTGLAVLLTLLGGFLGGIVYELLSLQGNIEFPHRYASAEGTNDEQYKIAGYAIAGNLYDLGLLARVFLGGMAAIAALLIITPSDIFKLLATSVIAGSAGASVFDTLRSRLLATAAVADATAVRAQAAQLDDSLAEAERALTDIQSAMIPTSRGAAALEASPTDIAEEINRAKQALGEARGIRRAMTIRR
jgi:hypothetical protein